MPFSVNESAVLLTGCGESSRWIAIHSSWPLSRQLEACIHGCRLVRLPSGLSLDWLASSLARRGIGLLPLATFARTEKGFETGRTTFRLTLGGVDQAETLLAKTRHLLIDLNRLMTDEDAQYNRKPLSFRTLTSRSSRSIELARDG